MKITGKAKAVAGAVALSAAFMGGIALAPMLVAPAAAQLLGGNAGQVAVTGPSGDQVVTKFGPGVDLFSAAAQYIGITTDQLRTELGSDKSLADVAVAHGKTRDGLIQALKTAEEQNIDQRIGDLVDHKGFPKPFGPGGPGGRGLTLRGEPLTAASTYLGISTTDLETKLRAGQTLAQIANATAGKSSDGLIQAVVQDETAKIDQAVKDGKLTADQATKIKAGITDRVTNMVNGTFPRGGPGSHVQTGPGGDGFHFGFGPRPAAPSPSTSSNP